LQCRKSTNTTLVQRIICTPTDKLWNILCQVPTVPEGSKLEKCRKCRNSMRSDKANPCRNNSSPFSVAIRVCQLIRNKLFSICSTNIGILHRCMMFLSCGICSASWANGFQLEAFLQRYSSKYRSVLLIFSTHARLLFAAFHRVTTKCTSDSPYACAQHLCVLC